MRQKSKRTFVLSSCCPFCPSLFSHQLNNLVSMCGKSGRVKKNSSALPSSRTWRARCPKEGRMQSAMLSFSFLRTGSVSRPIRAREARRGANQRLATIQHMRDLTKHGCQVDQSCKEKTLLCLYESFFIVCFLQSVLGLLKH